VTVIPVGFGEKEENDRIPSRKLKSSLKSPVPYHKQNGGPPRSISGLNDPPEIVITDTDSESESDVDPGRTNFSLVAGDSFNRRALTALKELDAVMAAEVSDLDATSSVVEDCRKFSSNQTSPKLPSKNKSISFTEEVMVHAPPPPPRKYYSPLISSQDCIS
jgi:hypothetical protein